LSRGWSRVLREDVDRCGPARTHLSGNKREADSDRRRLLRECAEGNEREDDGDDGFHAVDTEHYSCTLMTMRPRTRAARISSDSSAIFESGSVRLSDASFSRSRSLSSRDHASSRFGIDVSIELTPRSATLRRMSGKTVVFSSPPPAIPHAAIAPSYTVCASSVASVCPPTVSIAPAHFSDCSGPPFFASSSRGTI